MFGIKITQVDEEEFCVEFTRKLGESLDFFDIGGVESKGLVEHCLQAFEVALVLGIHAGHDPHHFQHWLCFLRKIYDSGLR